MKDTEIELRGERARTRYPDLIVLTDELKEALRGRDRSIILWDMPAPALVVEIGSDRRSDQFNFSDYAARGVPECWIADRSKQQMKQLLLTNGEYEETVISGDQEITSSALPGLVLTLSEIFATTEKNYDSRES